MHQNILDPAGKDITQVIQRSRRDVSVVLERVQCAAAEGVILDERIGRIDVSSNLSGEHVRDLPGRQLALPPEHVHHPEFRIKELHARISPFCGLVSSSIHYTSCIAFSILLS